jgi:hypothetical protein
MHELARTHNHKSNRDSWIISPFTFLAGSLLTGIAIFEAQNKETLLGVALLNLNCNKIIVLKDSAIFQSIFNSHEVGTYIMNVIILNGRRTKFMRMRNTNGRKGTKGM